MGAVIDAFAQAAVSAGCAIRTGVDVTGVRVNDDKISGVLTGDGTEFSAPLVVTSTGALQTCALAGPSHFDIETTRRTRNIRARGTVAKINLQLSELPRIKGVSDEQLRARLILAPSAEEVEMAFNPAKYGEMSSKPVIEALLPGLIDQAQRNSDRTHILSAIVQYAPSDLAGAWTPDAKDQLLTAVLQRLAAVAPDLPASVVDAEVISPRDIEEQTGAPGGHWHHAEMSLDQLLTLRPANGLGRYAFGPKGLYLCGASTHPGGDIMGLSGRNAALAALGATP